MMICPNCGEQYKDGTAMCQMCGAPLMQQFYQQNQFPQQSFQPNQFAQQPYPPPYQQQPQKKKHGCFVALGVFMLFCVIFSSCNSLFGGSSSYTSDRHSTQSESSTASTEKKKETEPKKTEPKKTESTTTAPHRTGGSIIGVSDKKLSDLDAKVEFSETVPNDHTERWRLAKISGDFQITDYLLDYYNTYFKNDKEVHAIINSTLKTTTRINCFDGVLSVTNLKYVNHEEDDAVLLFTGDVIDSYFVYLDNGDIEIIDDSTNETETESNVEAIEPETPESDNAAFSFGQTNALDSAKSYIRTMAFSYEGLIEQLEFERYTHDEAVYGADNCGADWNAEALECAKSYIGNMGFSYTGLIEQLEYEKFTHEQAVYGADNCNADWNAEAAEAAQSYLSFTSFSREELIDQLIYEGYTREQAEYGVSAAGY